MKLPYTEVKSAIGALTKAINKSKNLELSTAALDLQSIISQLISEDDDLEHENKRLKDQLADAQKSQLDRSNLVKYKGIWIVNEQTRSEVKAAGNQINDDLLAKMYCPVCLGKDSRLVSLSGGYSQYGYAVECPVCKFYTVLKRT